MILALLITPAAASSGQGPVVMDPIGKHHRIFKFEKNENPQNILIGYTRLDSSCRFERQAGRPSFDLYWLLDGTRFKDPHRLIKKHVRKSFAHIETEASKAGLSDVFEMRLIESKDMKTSLKEATIRVNASKGKGSCNVETLASFRQPDGAMRTIKLKTIRSETKKTWMPPFRRIVSITLEGESVTDGRLVTQVFN